MADSRFADLQDPISWSRGDLTALEKLSDEQLKDMCFGAKPDRGFFRGDQVKVFENCLLEIVRRGGPSWETFLGKLLEEMRADDKDKDGRQMGVIDLEILTALRRLQKKKDPLEIHANLEGDLASISPRMPTISVTMKQRDGEEDFVVTQGGNYRSGRQARWTVLLWNEEGALMPRSPQIMGLGGGMIGRGVLGDGTWQTSLDISKFVQGPLKPGLYRGRVAYHDNETIADMEDRRGLVMSFSNPISFRVNGRNVASLIKRDEIRPLVQGLPKEGQVKLLKGYYPARGMEWIPLSSNEGKLMSYEWNAVPSIIAELKDASLSETQRAWGLGILHTITGIMDPVEEGENLIGEFLQRGGGFHIVHKSNGRFSGSGSGFGGYRSSSGGKIDQEGQLTFLNRWEEVAKTQLIFGEKSYRYSREGGEEIPDIIVGDEGSRVRIQFSKESDQVARHVLSRLLEIRNVEGFFWPENVRGVELLQEIDLVGELKKEVKTIEPESEKDWTREYQEFVLTGVQIAFPFSILDKATQWDTGVVTTHVSINTLFPEGLKLDGKEIDLTRFVKAR